MFIVKSVNFCKFFLSQNDSRFIVLKSGLIFVCSIDFFAAIALRSKIHEIRTCALGGW
jgi:hypothetical protein